MAIASWRSRLSWRAALCVLGVTVLLGLGTAYLMLARPAAAPDAAPPPRRVLLPPGTYPSAPLAPGTPAPPIKAAGWLNGAPPQPGQRGHRWIVLDIWAHW